MSAIAVTPKVVRSMEERDVYLVSAHKKAPRSIKLAKYENIASAIVLMGSRFREIFEINI